MTKGLVLTNFWDASTRELMLELRNQGSAAMTVSGLQVSGIVRFDEGAVIAGAQISTSISNATRFVPPLPVGLVPGEAWRIVASQLVFPLQHWNDAVTGAYAILSSGEIVPVRVAPPVLAGSNEPPRRGLRAFPAPQALADPIAVSPWPRAVAIAAIGETPQGLAPTGVSPAARAAIAGFEQLTHALFPGEGLVRPRDEGGLVIHLEEDADFGPEAYAITFTPDAVRVAASYRAGFLYGLITLGQVLRGAQRFPQAYGFPSDGTISDNPALGFRGCHLDVARQFYASAEIRHFLNIMAWHKLNRFHWHLTDDEGWRIEIDAYPELTRVGAWRGEGLAMPPLLGSGAKRHGGFYSKAAVRQIVAHAETIGVTVVPEIDFPGHCFAIVTAMPHLADPDEAGAYGSVQGFANNCLNPAVEAIYPVIETILGEVIALFPGSPIHVGADEVPKMAWQGSPLAQSMLRALGASEAEALQVACTKRIKRFLDRQGRITGAWEEAAHFGGIDRKDTYLVGWSTPEACRRLADLGYDVVVSPGQAYYLDMAQDTHFLEPGASWAGIVDAETAYRYDPRQGWSAAQAERLLGIQACIWCEAMGDRAHFDRLVFPRLWAIAETAWTEPDRKDFRRLANGFALYPVMYQHWQSGASEAAA